MKSIVTAGALVLAMFPAGAFGAAQTKGQQKCINTLNKGMAKVTATQLKANAKCITGYAKGKNTDAETCFSTATKVDEARSKVCTAETKKCTGTPPDFGKSNCNVVNSVSESYAQDLAYALLSFSPNSTIKSCSVDKPGCKCQAQVIKGATKLFNTHLKEFNKCKKKGLKNKTAPIMSATDLAGCVSSDPKMKIAKAQLKLEAGITKKCNGVAVPFSGGSCATQVGPALSLCLEKKVRCEVCLIARASDQLSIDCDDYDDDLPNGSCGGD